MTGSGEIYVVVKSITFAYKAKSILKKNNIKSYIERTPDKYSNEGCTNALRIPAKEDEALKILQNSNIKIVAVYKGSEPVDLSR